MATTSEKPMRIGQVAELTGVTPRTIRYYEEIGLLDAGPDREQGKHRCYTQGDVDAINEIVRLRNLLGLSLEQLSQLLEAEQQRAAIRKEYLSTDDPGRHRTLLGQSLGHLTIQLELVHGRMQELTRLEADLLERRERVLTRLADLG